MATFLYIIKERCNMFGDQNAILADKIENIRYKLLQALYPNDMNNERYRSLDNLVEDLISEYKHVKHINEELKSNFRSLVGGMSS